VAVHPQGALANLKHSVGRGTIANVLKRTGIEPAPERGKRASWATFLRAHWNVLACDPPQHSQPSAGVSDIRDAGRPGAGARKAISFQS
jgi:hypothetical protein